MERKRKAAQARRLDGGVYTDAAAILRAKIEVLENLRGGEKSYCVFTSDGARLCKWHIKKLRVAMAELERRGA